MNGNLRDYNDETFVVDGLGLLNEREYVLVGFRLVLM